MEDCFFLSENLFSFTSFITIKLYFFLLWLKGTASLEVYFGFTGSSSAIFYFFFEVKHLTKVDNPFLFKVFLIQALF